MNTATTSALKQQLLQQRATVLEQLHNLRGGSVGRAQASAEHFIASEDTDAQLNTARDLEFALDEHETAELAQIDAALQRMAAGTYGQCLDCGDDIPLARLQATPQALRCIDCQQKAE